LNATIKYKFANYWIGRKPDSLEMHLLRHEEHQASKAGTQNLLN